LNDFKFTSKFQYEFGNSSRDEYHDKRSYVGRDIYNKTSPYNEDTGVLSHNIPYGDIYDADKTSTNSYLIRNQVSYNKSFNDSKHHVSVLAGTEVSKTLTKGNFNRMWGYDRQTLIDIPIATGPVSASNLWYLNLPMPDDHIISEIENRFFSTYANASFTYNNKYTLDGSIRLDKSNLFGKNPKYTDKPIWSAGLNWNLSKEDFFNVDWVNKIMLKVTYGINGNVNTNVTPATTAIGGLREEGSLAVLDITDPENNQLRWEQTKTLNFTLDYDLFNHRLSGDIQFYRKKGVDLLGNALIDPTNGFTHVYKNTSSILNKGVDLSITGIVFKGDFRWASSLNFGYNEGEVLENLPAANFFRSMNTPLKGKPINALAFYKYAGLSAEGLPQVYDGKGNKIVAGSDMEDLDALTYKNSTPKYFGAFVNNFHYKGFRLSTTFNFKLGYSMRNPDIISDAGVHRGYGFAFKSNVARWAKPGDEKITNLPRVSSSLWEYSDVANLNSFYNKSDQMHLNASHIRLRDVVLAYSLPKKYLSKLPFSKIEVSVQGRNLALWTANKQGIDPGAIRNGYSLFPESRSFSFGLKASF
jgi:hypothetical protein